MVDTSALNKLGHNHDTLQPLGSGHPGAMRLSWGWTDMGGQAQGARLYLGRIR
ncbi:MAG: hypothetical protein PVH17_03530 [Anaerolineae bacterium]|jgi:hypothetical protein